MLRSLITRSSHIVCVVKLRIIGLFHIVKLHIIGLLLCSQTPHHRTTSHSQTPHHWTSWAPTFRMSIRNAHYSVLSLLYTPVRTMQKNSVRIRKIRKRAFHEAKYGQYWKKFKKLRQKIYIFLTDSLNSEEPCVSQINRLVMSRWIIHTHTLQSKTSE